MINLSNINDSFTGQNNNSHPSKQPLMHRIHKTQHTVATVTTVTITQKAIKVLKSTKLEFQVAY